MLAVLAAACSADLRAEDAHVSGSDPDDAAAVGEEKVGSTAQSLVACSQSLHHGGGLNGFSTVLGCNHCGNGLQRAWFSATHTGQGSCYPVGWASSNENDCSVLLNVQNGGLTSFGDCHVTVHALPPNVAANKQAWASSEWGAPYTVTRAVNASAYNDDGWSPSANDQTPWLQVDLGQRYRLHRVELVTRQGCCDQPEARRNFAIWASNEVDMSHSHVVLGQIASDGVAHKSTFTKDVEDSTGYRYIAAVKSVPDEYFFISELRAYGVPEE
jgi:hypothetical protein